MHIFRKGFGKILVFAGLVVALLLGICGAIVVRNTAAPPISLPSRPSIAELDARAAPFFKKARLNIPVVVRQLSESKTVGKLCFLMARDKLTGTRLTAEYLQNILEQPILQPCCQGAKIYGCRIDSASFIQQLQRVHADYSTTQAYAAGGLAVESLFLKSTIASLRTVLGHIAARLAGSCSAGVLCAAADGPFPIGDAIGTALAVGGTAWCAYDLYCASTKLPGELSATLLQCVHDFRTACRMEAMK